MRNVATRFIGRHCDHTAARRIDVAVVFDNDVALLRSLGPELRWAVIDPAKALRHPRMLVRALRRGRPRGRSFIAAAIGHLRPRVVITTVDNYVDYYTLKREFPEVTFVTLQNGVRGFVDDTLEQLREISRDDGFGVDHAFVYGSAAASLLPACAARNVHMRGSFRSNLVARWTGPRSGIAYISTYRPWLRDEDVVPVSIGGRRVTYGDLHQWREKVVRFVATYAEQNDQEFTIIGKNENPDHDRRYYDSVLGSHGYRLAPRTDQLASYRAVDRACVTVFTSSTLGYEALARGGRVAGFTIGGSLLGCREQRFGWPLHLPDTGPFWTNRYSEVDFSNILAAVCSMDDAEWRRVTEPIVSQLMEWDEGNSDLISLLTRTVRSVA